MLKPLTVALLAWVLLLAGLPAARAEGPHAPERVMLGRTGEVAHGGQVRLSWIDVATLFLTFAPFTGLELSTGQMLGFGTGFMGMSADGRFRVLHLDMLDVAVGGGFIASYDIERKAYDGSTFRNPRIPMAELAATWKTSNYKFNLCTRYLAVMDETVHGQVAVTGIDDLVFHAGMIGLADEAFSWFAELTVGIPMTEAKGLHNRYAGGAGGRWLYGPWAFELGGWLPGVLWVGASAAFDLY